MPGGQDLPMILDPPRSVFPGGPAAWGARQGYPAVPSPGARCSYPRIAAGGRPSPSPASRRSRLPQAPGLSAAEWPARSRTPGPARGWESCPFHALEARGCARGHPPHTASRAAAMAVPKWTRRRPCSRAAASAWPVLPGGAAAAWTGVCAGFVSPFGQQERVDAGGGGRGWHPGWDAAAAARRHRGRRRGP